MQHPATAARAKALLPQKGRASNPSGEGADVPLPESLYSPAPAPPTGWLCSHRLGLLDDSGHRTLVQCIFEVRVYVRVPSPSSQDGHLVYIGACPRHGPQLRQAFPGAQLCLRPLS